MIREIHDLEIDYINSLGEYQVKKNPFSLVIVYIMDGKIIGFLDYSVIYERMEINYIYVQEEYRRQNIGLTLIGYIIENHKECENITLEVNIYNEAAIHLYEKLGFKTVSKRLSYYNGVDAYLMERRLP